MQDELTPQIVFWIGAAFVPLGTAVTLVGVRMIRWQRRRIGGTTRLGTLLLVGFGASLAAFGLLMLGFGALTGHRTS